VIACAKQGAEMNYDPKSDDRWTYFVTGFDQERGLVCVMAGNPHTAEYVADLFRKDGLTHVNWENKKSD
jgi:hypothetical protein